MSTRHENKSSWPVGSTEPWGTRFLIVMLIIVITVLLLSLSSLSSLVVVVVVRHERTKRRNSFPLQHRLPYVICCTICVFAFFTRMLLCYHCVIVSSFYRLAICCLTSAICKPSFASSRLTYGRRLPICKLSFASSAIFCLTRSQLSKGEGPDPAILKHTRHPPKVRYMLCICCIYCY